MGSIEETQLKYLSGKTIVVTGGASGIGLAGVQFFASLQASKIYILDISTASSVSLLPSLQKSHSSSTFGFKQCDISSWEIQARVFKEIYEESGSIDLVFANAGVSEIGKFLEEEKDDEEPRKPGLKTLDINLTGTLYSIKLAIHYMRKNSGSQKGLIICTASNAGLYPFPIAPMYSVSKHAVVGAVRSLARPLQDDGIRINGICPNCIATGLADEKLFSVMKLTPMETLIDALREFVFNERISGITAEISGEKFTIAQPQIYVDDITTHNLEAFWKLGYA